jgi:hypothetical protein
MSSEMTTRARVSQTGASLWWLLWPVTALAPHGLYFLQLDYAAMLTIYVAWPATMGPLALAYVYVWQKMVILNSFWGWLLALALAGAWGALLVAIRRWRPTVALGLFLLGVLPSGLLLWQVIIPPT